jgi:hypothetical protein
MNPAVALAMSIPGVPVRRIGERRFGQMSAWTGAKLFLQEDIQVKFMMMIKAPEGVPPSAELIAAVGKLSQEMAAAGILLQAGGLASSANGAKVRLKGSKLTVIDGPFTEAKELIGGFAILKASSRAEAIEHGKRFMQLHADIDPSYEGECEIRELFDSPTGKP